MSSTAKRVSDFVWAIRLAKISQGLLNRIWSHQTFGKGATFGLDDEQDQGKVIRDILKNEGFDDNIVVEIDKAGPAFVMQGTC